MVPGALAGMEKLRILSLGRNQIKRIEGLAVRARSVRARDARAPPPRRHCRPAPPRAAPRQDVAGTLEELWMSYNQLASLEGLQACGKLRVLYAGNNCLREWAEVERLAELPALRELLLAGNPLYDGADRAAARLQVLKRLPALTKLDNELILDSERAAAAAL